MERKIPLKTLYLIAIISLGLVGLAVGSTFAMFVYEDEINNVVSLNAATLASEEEIAESVNVSLTGGGAKTITLNITNDSDNDLNYTTWYTIPGDISIGIEEESDDPTGEILSDDTKYIIVRVRNNSNTQIEGIIGISTSSDSNIVLASNMTVVPNNVVLLENGVEHISNLYTNADKETADNGNSSSGIVTYHLAPDVSLMNDRLGSMDTDIDGGNIRYYGATPDNYVYFNCTDYTNQTSSTCELWRIIGVFETEDEYGNVDKKLKIINTGIFAPKPNNSYTNTFSWDNSSVNSGLGINQWGESVYTTGEVYTGADLMKLLNPGYENNMDNISGSTDQVLINNSLYWNRSSGNCYDLRSLGYKSCDFTSTGLKDNSKGLISNVVWNTGAISTKSLYSHEMYLAERGTTVRQNPNDNVVRTTTWTGKIALPYASDYGYAADFSLCNKNISDDADTGYNNTTCSNNNYLVSLMSGCAYLNTYTESNYSIYYSATNKSGILSTSASGRTGVHPALYLNSDVVFEKGNGTDTSPYRLLVR